MAAYSVLGKPDAPAQVSLGMLDGRPVYRFSRGRSLALVYADEGEVFQRLSQESADRIADAWTGQPAGTAQFMGAFTAADQWTLAGQLAPLRPLLKFRWQGGREVYVSAVTGDVVQDTTRASRLAAYLGAIPHWLYFAPLRRNGRLWSRVVIWTSGVGTITSLLGLVAGVWVYSPTKRFRHPGTPLGLPYHGQKRWHLMLGLIFGLITCTWVFSGLLSMEPFEWLSDDTDAAFAVAESLRGGGVSPAAFGAKSPSEALRQLGAAARVKELELRVLSGEPYYIARESEKAPVIIPVHGDPVGQFDTARILQLIRDAVRPSTVRDSRVVTSYEAYYLDRHNQHPLPALFVRLNDPASSMLYVDLKTAKLVEAYGARSRINRWLYHGLHSWNPPWLYRYRPAWDIVVLTLLLGGTSLCITSVIIAFQLLRRKLWRQEEPT